MEGMTDPLVLSELELDGKVRAYFQSSPPSSRISVISWLGPAGASRDPAGKDGLAYLTGRGLLSGTRHHSKMELARHLDRLAATLTRLAGLGR